MIRFARFHGPSEQVGHGVKDSYRFSRQHGGGGGGGGAVGGAVSLPIVPVSFVGLWFTMRFDTSFYFLGDEIFGLDTVFFHHASLNVKSHCTTSKGANTNGKSLFQRHFWLNKWGLWGKSAKSKASKTYNPVPDNRITLSNTVGG
jgi:hypothetical protein